VKCWRKSELYAPLKCHSGDSFARNRAVARDGFLIAASRNGQDVQHGQVIERLSGAMALMQPESMRSLDGLSHEAESSHSEKAGRGAVPLLYRAPVFDEPTFLACRTYQPTQKIA
jgi:hypothetical protein